MIQILNSFPDNSINNINISSNDYNNTNYNNKNNYNKFQFIFIFSIIICIFLIIIYIILIYFNNKNEKLSKSLINNFGITTLYSNSVDYSALKLNTNASTNNISNPFVIGLIKIDKINLTYPILSSTTDELLKISPCYFYGCMPNEIGNICIAGHNYSNDTIFGKIDLLNIGDIIRIYDLNSKHIDYTIYSIYEVSPSDTSCLNQNTYGKKEVTLITCNTLKGTRLILKAKENEVS